MNTPIKVEKILPEGQLRIVASVFVGIGVYSIANGIGILKASKITDSDSTGIKARKMWGKAMGAFGIVGGAFITYLGGYYLIAPDKGR